MSRWYMTHISGKLESYQRDWKGLLIICHISLYMVPMPWGKEQGSIFRYGYQWPKIGACIQRQKYLTSDVLGIIGDHCESTICQCANIGSWEWQWVEDITGGWWAGEPAGLIVSCRDSILLTRLEHYMHWWLSKIKNCFMKWNLEIICDHLKVKFRNTK